MLSLPPSVRIFLSREPADMRKGFDTLAQLAREHLGGDPLSGHLFVFRSRRGDRLKALDWDSDGLCLWYKRLEAGTFAFPSDGTLVGGYTATGFLSIDNNATERINKLIARGRVNWLFVGSPRGGETAALLLSLVVTCRRLHMDSFAYLRDVFTRLPR